MFVHFIIILSRSQQFPTSSSQNQVELGEWATGDFMHCGYDDDTDLNIQGIQVKYHTNENSNIPATECRLCGTR